MENKGWQESVTHEKRTKFISNIIEAVTVLQSPKTSDELELLNRATRQEDFIFNNAQSRADYYNQIAQLIYKIGESLDDGSESSEQELCSTAGIEEYLADIILTEAETPFDQNNQGQTNEITSFHVEIWLMLMHAFNCIIKNTECSTIDCSKFKELLVHLIKFPTFCCCKEYLCSPARLIIKHGLNCGRENCLLCKNLSELEAPAETIVKKEWHGSFTTELRQDSIHELLKSVNTLPSVVLASLREIEKEVYEEADSKLDYYHRLRAQKSVILQNIYNN